MERKEPQSIGDVLRDLLDESFLRSRMDELNAVRLWEKVTGREIASRCGKPTVKSGVMTVGVANACLRQELYINRTRLKEIINELIGKETIKEIRFVS